MPDADLSATLAGIRENDERVIALCDMAPAVVRQLAEHDVPLLLAALEAVLKLADEAGPTVTDWPDERHIYGWTLDPAKVREAITAELTGTGRAQPGEDGDP